MSKDNPCGYCGYIGSHARSCPSLEIDEALGRIEVLESDLAAFRAYVGDSMYRSDYRDVAEIRAALGACRKELAFTKANRDDIASTPEARVKCVMEENARLKAEVERYRVALDNIASGELGINVSIKQARKALEPK